MCQREWKGGEQMMRKQEMKHKVTEKKHWFGKKISREGKDCLAERQSLCVQHGGNFLTLSFHPVTSIGLL